MGSEMTPFFVFLGGASEAHPMGATKSDTPCEVGGQSPQNCTVRQCVTSKFDIKNFSKFIKIGLTTFKKYGISFKKTYRATSQTSMFRLASNSNF